MTIKKFDFWQDHSIQYLEMAFKSDKQGRLVKPDGYGKRKGDCGDTIEMFILVQHDLIDSISYLADGCMNTHACANTVIQMAEGKTLKDGWEITPELIIDFLGTLPEDEKHCAELAVGTFYKALSDIQQRLRKGQSEKKAAQ